MTRKPAKPRQRRSWARGPYRKPAKKVASRQSAPPAVAQVAKAPTISLAGLTPRERLDAIHAHQALLDLRQRQGELVERAQIDAGNSEMREVIRSDLLGTLPLRVASALAGRSRTAAEIRAVVRVAVREILVAWHQAGPPVPEGKA